MKNKDYTYYGQILNNKRNGIGVWKYKSGGRLYQGEFLNDKRHGKGKEVFGNLHTYQGNYHKGKIHGKGIYLWPSGESYVGNFYQGLKHGYGKWKKGPGLLEKYTGNWAW